MSCAHPGLSKREEILASGLRKFGSIKLCLIPDARQSQGQDGWMQETEVAPGPFIQNPPLF